jgi:hypothetical protein
MLSGTAVNVAGYAIEITFHDAVVIGLAILISLAFWAVLHFSRRRVIHIDHSEATNQIMLELSRIAVALQDIANRPADQVIAATNYREREPERVPEPERQGETRTSPPIIPPEHESESERRPRGMPYSLFGR